MRLSKLLAGIVAVPALLFAQVAPVPAKTDVKATFSVLKANVDKITAPSEKGRWEPNKDAWEVEVTQTGKLQKVDIGKLEASLGRIKENVSKIRAGSEKERWQANIDLWELFIACDGSFTKGDLPAATASLARMKENVAAIVSPVEKERWEANRDLWQAMIDRAGTK